MQTLPSHRHNYSRAITSNIEPLSYVLHDFGSTIFKLAAHLICVIALTNMERLMPDGWEIGARFRFRYPRGNGRFVHRIYAAPPCSDSRPRVIRAAELYVDFSQIYTIEAIYCSRKWLTVQFHAAHGRHVWTNVRKWGDWWCTLVH